MMTAIKKLWFTTFVVFGLTQDCYGGMKTCEAIDGLKGCACRMSDTKEIIALSDLVKNDTKHRVPRFITQDETRWKYAYHPCKNFNMFDHVTTPRPGHKKCIQMTAARFTSSSAHICDGLGAVNSGVFDYVTNSSLMSHFSGISITYRNLQIKSKGGAVIYLLCNEKLPLEDSKFTYVNVTEGVEETYYFSLESRCSCPNGCPMKKPSVAVHLRPMIGLVMFASVLVKTYVFH